MTRCRDLIAKSGFDIPLPDPFLRCASPPPQRKGFKTMVTPISKLAAKTWDNNVALIVETSVLLEVAGRSGESLGWNHNGWAPKRGKDSGRGTLDSPTLCYPRPEVREAAKNLLGPVAFPTLQDDLMPMILGMEDEFSNRCITLVKEDLQGAFNLIPFSVPSALLMCAEIGEGFSIISPYGNFGLVAMPYAFNIVSKLLRMAVNAVGRYGPPDMQRRAAKSRWGPPPVIRFVGEQYVDDSMLVQVVASLHSASSWLRSLARALLGDDAIATDKHECARGMVWIGWWIDLDNRRVTMAEHILLKLVFFLDQAEGTQVSGEVLEVIASLAERFSGVCPVLAVFKPHLYGSYCTLRHKEALVSVSTLVRTALALLRVLALEAWNGGGYPFDRFRPRAVSTVVEFDGSIYGLGGRVFRLHPDGSEELLLELALPLPPLVSSDSFLRVNSQNSCELLAAVVTALAAAFVLPPGNHGVRLRGDSHVALSCLSETHFKSLLSARTALAWTTLSHRLNLVITDQVHIPADQNQVCDDYSRGVVPSAKPGVLCVAASEGSPHPATTSCRTLVDMCNPAIASTSPLTTTADFNSFLSDICKLFSSDLAISSPLTSLTPPSWFSGPP